MKKLLFILLILGAAQAKAQDIIIKGFIGVKDSTFNRTIPFEVAAGTKSVKYTIKVFAAAGEVTVTLTDPNDKKSFNVTLGTKANSGGYGPSEGELSDDLKTKIPGTWKFNIRAENVTGRINYEIEIKKP
jgi:hypothetical protein